MLTQNGNNYFLNLNSPIGSRIDIIDKFFSLKYAKREKQLGKLSLILPLSWFTKITEYCQLEVWRSTTGQSSSYLDLETLWIILYMRPFLSSSGEYLLEVQAVDSNIVLLSRIIAYCAGTAQAKKSGFAGNLIKSIASENIGSAANDYTGTANTGTYPRGIPSNYFSIQGNLNDGATIDSSFAWSNCFDAMNDIADASATAGTYMGFDVVYDAISKLELRTYAGQRGTDRSGFGSNAITLDPNMGNLGATQIEYNYLNEVNFVYSGGQDSGINRMLATSANISRYTYGPFSRREAFTDARQSDTLVQVQDSADAALRDGRGRVIFTSTVIENPNNRYGIEYGFGDILSCQFNNVYTACRLDGVDISVEASEEKINVNMISVS